MERFLEVRRKDIFVVVPTINNDELNMNINALSSTAGRDSYKKGEAKVPPEKIQDS